jgi:membrane-bound serine protease (ClpP class)
VAQLARAQANARPLVFVAPIAGTIDLGLGPFVARILQAAEDEDAALVVLDIDTFGGRVDAAVSIRDALLRTRVPTIAFINKRAISAGALIALASEKIAIAQGGTIGAAAPVELGQPGEAAKPVGEKTVSYVRKEFRATADARGRPGLLAEAMVDADVEIPGLITKGKLLTLTAEDALTHDLADFAADDLGALLAEVGLADAEVRTMSENWAEKVVRFLTDPIVASLLMSLGLLGLAVELRTPGFGFPGMIGLLCLGSFFWGHWLVQLVGWEQLALLGVGALLLLLEVFVIPGFGVAGAAGIAALVAALGSSLVGAGATPLAVALVASRVAISLSVAGVAFLLLLRFRNFMPGNRELVLGSALTGDGRTELQRLPAGARGVALSPLRPAGIATFDGRRVDVVANGDFIDAGLPLEVLSDEGHRVVVKLCSTTASEGTRQ